MKINATYMAGLFSIACFLVLNGATWWQRFSARMPKFSRISYPSTTKVDSLKKVQKPGLPKQLPLAKNTLEKIGLASLGLATAYLLTDETSCDYSCQTDAYLSLEGAKEAVDIAYAGKIKELNLQPILDAAVEKEREMAIKGYYAFYHGEGKNIFLYQKIVTEYMQQLAGREFKDFYFLRYPEPSFDKDISFQSLASMDNEYDLDPAISQRLLSVNLSLYGNAKNLGESSLYYAMEDLNITGSGSRALLTFFKMNSLDVKLLYELAELAEKAYATGTLLQIFVPQHAVEKIGYPSRAFGHPGFEVGREIFKPFDPQSWTDYYALYPNYPFKKTILPAKLEELPANSSLLKLLENYKKDPLSLSSDIKQTVEFNWKSPVNSVLLARDIASGKFKKSSEIRFKAVNWLQARLILNNKILLNPDSGIKIFSYTKKDNTLEKRLNEKIKQVVVEALKKKSEKLP